MKSLTTFTLILFAPFVLASHGDGKDDSLQASYTASCNASFQQDCPDVPTEVVASESLAAPFGSLGDSYLELAALILVTGFFLSRHLRQRGNKSRVRILR